MTDTTDIQKEPSPEKYNPYSGVQQAIHQLAQDPNSSIAQQNYASAQNNYTEMTGQYFGDNVPETA